MIQEGGRNRRCQRGRQFRRPRGSSRARADELGIIFELRIHVNSLTLPTLLMTTKVVSCELYVANGELLGSCQATSVTSYIVGRARTDLGGVLVGEWRVGHSLACARESFGNPVRSMRFWETKQAHGLPGIIEAEEKDLRILV